MEIPWLASPLTHHSKFSLESSILFQMHEPFLLHSVHQTIDCTFRGLYSNTIHIDILFCRILFCIQQVPTPSLPSYLYDPSILPWFQDFLWYLHLPNYSYPGIHYSLQLTLHVSISPSALHRPTCSTWHYDKVWYATHLYREHFYTFY